MAATTRHHQALVQRTPFYYGWVVWAVATFCIIATAPSQAFSLSLFIDGFIDEFNLTRTSMSALFSGGTFLASLSLAWIGHKIDVYGNRRVGMIVISLFVLVIIGMSRVNGWLSLLVGLYLLRMLGQGSLMLTSNTAIARWFSRRRGRMMSLAILVFALFQAVYVPWLGRFLEAHPWRDVFVMLGIAVGVILLPIFWIFLQDRPEEFGLHSDGRRMTREEIIEESSPLNNWRLREAWRTPIFWIFVMGRIASPAIGSALIFHQVSIFASHGYSASFAAETFGRVSLVSAAATLLYGYLVDHIRPGRVLSLQVSAAIVSAIFAMLMHHTWITYVYALTFGFVIGGGGVFDGAAWANLFGREHVGEIVGFVRTAQIIGTSLGPIFVGFSYDYLGGYTPAFGLMIAYALIPAVGSFLMSLPNQCRRSPQGCP